MATGAGGDGFLRGMYEGCISAGDMGIQRRPYHKNCKCALHGKSRDHCTRHSPCNNISYPIRRSWSESSLALMANSTAASPSSNSTPRSPATEIQRTHTQLMLYGADGEEIEDLESVSLISRSNKV